MIGILVIHKITSIHDYIHSYDDTSMRQGIYVYYTLNTKYQIPFA